MKRTSVGLKLGVLILMCGPMISCASSSSNLVTESQPSAAQQQKEEEAAEKALRPTNEKSGFQLRPYTAETLDNGLQVLYIEDHSLPSISFSVLLKDGSASDPMAKSGLMNLMASVLVRGSISRTAQQIADTLGQLGTQFEESVTDDYSWFEVSGLSIHQKTLFDVFSDVLLRPRFDKKEIERQRKLTLASIEQLPDHPEAFASDAFSAYLFGGHPYARPNYGLKGDVKSIERKDLFKNYVQRFRPNNAILVVTGDLNNAVKESLKKTFETWQKGDVPPVNFQRRPDFKGLNIRLVGKPDLTQSQIIIGQAGIKRSDPDYQVLRVASIILGGDFSSRLMSQVRVKLGLTYGISSSFDAKMDPGAFIISTFTKNQSVGKTIEETLKVLREFCNDGVTKEEVDSAKNYMMGAFPRVIETPEKLGFNLSILRLYGISDDYLKNFIVNVSKITRSEVNEAIKKHIDPDDLKVLVLSNTEQAAPQLRPLGFLEIKQASEIF